MDATVSKGPLSDEELAAAKRYMCVEGDEDDLVVSSLVLAAREYLARAGVSLPGLDSPRRPLYDLVCHSIALGSYGLREDTVTGTSVAENHAMRRMLNQLKLTEPQN